MHKIIVWLNKITKEKEYKNWTCIEKNNFKEEKLWNHNSFFLISREKIALRHKYFKRNNHTNKRKYI